MSEQDQIDQIERDRRKREREMLLLLLMLTADSRKRAVWATRLGHDPIAAAEDVWLSNADIEHDGAAPIIAEQMALAEVAGATRAYLMAGMRMPPIEDDDFEKIVEGHAAEAETVANLTWQAIEPKLTQAYQQAYPSGIAATVKAVRQAFDDAGVTESSSATLDRGVERQVVEKFNGGMWQAFKGDAGHHLIGFRHRSILDNGTTAICNERDGLTLRSDNAYWLSNWPSLHWGCRSIILPLFGDSIVESDWLPEIPPAPGFGRVPSAELGLYFRGGMAVG